MYPKQGIVDQERIAVLIKTEDSIPIESKCLTHTAMFTKESDGWNSGPVLSFVTLESLHDSDPIVALWIWEDDPSGT